MDSDGHTIAVGATGITLPGMQIVGNVWVISKTGTAGQTVERLRPGMPFTNLRFGVALALDDDGDTLVVGAPRSGTGYPGWVYVYRHDGRKWDEDFRFNSAYQSDGLGSQVAMNGAGDLMAAGAGNRYWAGSFYTNGAVDVFRRDATGWVQEFMITPLHLTPPSIGLGAALAMTKDGRFLATRAFSDANSPLPNGAVYVFERTAPGSWTQVAWLQEPVAYSSGGFGAKLAFSADANVLAASNWQDSRFAYTQGAVSIFRRSGASWAYDTAVLPTNPVTGGYFGYAMTLNTAGDRMLVGEPGAKVNGVKLGAVEEFECVAGSWRSVAKHFSPEPQHGETYFGQYVVGGGATLGRWATGAPLSDTFGPDVGIVHIYQASCLTPSVYCTSQVNSLGCTPSVTHQGSPSASASSGFVITANSIRNQQNGVLFYGVNERAALPWLGGTLCVEPPLRRTPLSNSGGSPAPANDCSGELSLDFNAWAALSNDPTLFPGQRVRAQFYSRDVGAPSNLNLTDAIEFYLEP